MTPMPAVGSMVLTFRFPCRRFVSLLPPSAPPSRSRFQVWDAVFCDREVKRDNLLHFRDMRETEQHNGRLVPSAQDDKMRYARGCE